MKKIISKKKVILFASITLLIMSCILIFIKSKQLKISLKKDRTLEINTKAYNSDYIKKIKNGKIIKKELIDSSKIGTKTITIYIKNHFGSIIKYKYKINIKDTQKPIITYNKELTTEEGTEIDLLKDVKANDNSKKNIKITIEGEYDINKPGTYKLFYVAKDKSGNEAKEEFNLTVTQKTNIIQVSNITNQEETFTTSKGFKGYKNNGITYIDGYMIANKTYSLPKTYNPGLDENVKNQANIMFAAAKKEGLNLYISSGFRSYETQAGLYQSYINRDGKDEADTYSARPGHSEHQTGLAFDVNEVSQAFNNTPEAIWLSNNCYKFGFILRYPNGKTNETGYMYESWHFRYVGKDLATKLYNGGNWITLESYFGITSNY